MCLCTLPTLSDICFFAMYKYMYILSFFFCLVFLFFMLSFELLCRYSSDISLSSSRPH